MTISQNSYIFQAKVAEQTPHVINGDGIYITVERDGKTSRLIDAMTGAAVGGLGWGDAEVHKYINDAAKVSSYSYPACMGNKHAEALGDYFIKNSPPGAFAAALWTTSGSESNENALKLIRQYHVERGHPEKTKFISRKVSYHGFTIGALSISSSARSAAFQPILLPEEQCLKMEACYPYRYKGDDETMDQYVQRLLDNLENLILDNDPKTIASVTVETLPGSSLGTSPPPPGYLPGIRKLCTKYDVVFMLDEVMCGTGRASPNGGFHCWENYLTAEEGPDIQTIGKVLGSGYVTIAGILVSPKFREAFVNGSGQIMGSHTYTGHAFNCAVALKIQERINELQLHQNIFEKGNAVGKKLQLQLANAETVGDVRGLGGFWSIEFVKNKLSKESFPMELDIGHRFQDICFDMGLSVMGMQGCDYGKGDHVMLAPHFIVTDEDVDTIVATFVKAIKKMEEELKTEGLI